MTYLPGYNGNHETISGPDLYMLFDHSASRSQAAFDFVTWLTSAKVHLKFAIATGDLPLRQSETKLPGYQTFLKKFPAEKVFVTNLDNVKHVRPNIAAYGQVSDDDRDRWCSRSCSVRPAPTEALKSTQPARSTAALAGS